MTTAKHGIISTERETEEGGIMEDGTNKQRGDESDHKPDPYGDRQKSIYTDQLLEKTQIDN